LINENDITVLEAVLIGILPSTKEKNVMKEMVTKGDPTNKISL
jgi:hypothetical protein